MIGKTEAVISKPAVRFQKILDYIEMMKPELTGLSVLTALCGAFLVGEGNFEVLLWVGFGTLLVGGGAGVLNQYIEREYDAAMKRTERRPLPLGRVSGGEAIVFGVLLSIVGILVLAIGTTVLATALAVVTWVSYLFVYTPLKRRSPVATLVGGIPGALPPMIGWSAATGDLSAGAWILFAILFFWQMPHFYSLAWMYRKDYARAGFMLLPAIDEKGFRTGLHMIVHSIALLPAAIGLTLLGMTGETYFVMALILTLLFALYSVLFTVYAKKESQSARIQVNQYSRRVFFASLLYLPLLMGSMLLDRF
ncbi:MAG TPA: heme o synthase [Bacteroidota bacterium]|nr:heme o synthase [Bacteroidota bacterium]